MSSVMAIANTPSLKASTRDVGPITEAAS